ncbi:MAG TPA: hypothetical protein VIR98_01305 [Candidatus Paceibacterota bacterium]
MNPELSVIPNIIVLIVGFLVIWRGHKRSPEVRRERPLFGAWSIGLIFIAGGGIGLFKFICS